MKQIIFSTIAFVFLVALGYGTYAYFSPDKKSADPSGAEPIKAEIINDDPSAFTINVEFMENMDADTNADLFAVYISEDKPSDCGDFSDTELSYNKPEEHHRRFDLSDHDDILNAIDSKQCVIIPNVPASSS